MKKIEQELAEAKSAVKEKQFAYENCVKTVSSLEKSIKEHDNNRESRLKGLEKKIKSIKSQMQSSLKDLKVCLKFQRVMIIIYNLSGFATINYICSPYLRLLCYCVTSVWKSQVQIFLDGVYMKWGGLLPLCRSRCYGTFDETLFCFGFFFWELLEEAYLLCSHSFENCGNSLFVLVQLIYFC